MTIEITPLYAMLQAVLLFLLWLNVVKQRAASQVSVGHGDDVALHEKIRRHGNFVEFVPVVLLMMTLAELREGNAIALHVSGALLLLSRVLHPYGLHHDNMRHVLRIVGNSGSLLALFLAVAAIAATYL